MIPTKPLLLSASILLTACISLPDIDSAHSEVRVVTPAETAYTNGTIQLQLEVKGTPPAKVELLINNEVLTTLESPYTFTWDTTSVTEGRYRVTGRAQVAGESFTSEAREIVVDRTPPQIVSRQPAPDATDVGVRQPIQATFSEPVNPQSLTEESVRLTLGSTNIARALSLAPDGRTVTVVPSSSLSVPNKMAVTLTSAVVDLAGNSLQGAPEVWRWTVPTLIPLGPPLDANPGSTSASDPHLKLDPAGNPVVTWVEHDGAAPNIYVSRWTGSQWQALGGGLRVGAGSIVATSPTLQVDSAGTPFVAWHEGHGSNEFDYDYVYVARWNNNQWTLLGGTSVNSGSPGARSFSFRLDRSGSPVIAISHASMNNGDVTLFRWDGNQWQSIASSTGLGRLISLELTAADVPTMAWLQPGDSLELCLTEWTGTNWQPIGGPSNAPCIQALTMSAYSPYNPYPGAITIKPEGFSLKFDTAGRPIAIWLERDNFDGPLTIHAHKWTGLAWEPICNTPSPSIDTGATFYSANASVHLDSLDALWLTWTVFSSTTPQTPHIWRCQSNTWSPVVEEEFTNAFSPGTAFAGDFQTDAQRNMTLAIIKHDSTSDSIQVYTSNRQ